MLEISQIHQNDDMFVGDLHHYERVGREFCGFVRDAGEIAGFNSPKILELPCGYGRCTRHIADHFDRGAILVADVLPSAVDFCVKTFGVRGSTIKEPINEFLNIPDDYFDIAAMGSLITHMSEQNAHIILKNYMRKLRRGGIAVITTTGQKAFELLKSRVWFNDQIHENDKLKLEDAYSAGRYGFINYLQSHTFEKKTVDYIGPAYGMSMIPHQWIAATMNSLGCEIKKLDIGGWDNHQDVYYIIKS